VTKLAAASYDHTYNTTCRGTHKQYDNYKRKSVKIATIYKKIEELISENIEIAAAGNI
jgi:hypothetical protein